MAQDIVELRTGQFSSVFLTLNSASLNVIKRALMKKIKKSPSFFQHIAVILQFNAMLEKVNLSALKNLLAEFNIQVIGVADWQNNLQKELIVAAGFAVLGKSDDVSAVLPEPRYLPTKVIEQDVKATQVVYAKNSDLIIHGNVEAGAEVAADGNIHIYGKLRGRAMAGVNANAGSIYVQHLDAEFVAVNSRFLYKEKIAPEFMQRAVRIFAEKDKLAFRILGEY
ncbi:septum site-determining protein MinC [Necropsobacter massiliensis]|uniref:septum site-determining protein MinC n=1 Tax=Necropsobacter massiliensis TaxID=1400001 RepID=UPI000595CC05|nr:septum site-determining protein MinC [Necropsobacter massiliensis]